MHSSRRSRRNLALRSSCPASNRLWRPWDDVAIRSRSSSAMRARTCRASSCRNALIHPRPRIVSCQHLKRHAEIMPSDTLISGKPKRSKFNVANLTSTTGLGKKAGAAWEEERSAGQADIKSAAQQKIAESFPHVMGRLVFCKKRTVRQTHVLTILPAISSRSFPVTPTAMALGPAANAARQSNRDHLPASRPSLCLTRATWKFVPNNSPSSLKS